MTSVKKVYFKTRIIKEWELEWGKRNRTANWDYEKGMKWELDWWKRKRTANEDSKMSPSAHAPKSNWTESFDDYLTWL